MSAKLDRRTAAAFEDRVAIITGGASGIGLALGQQLAQCGARIIVADIDDAGAARAVQLLTQAGARSAEAVRVARRASAYEVGLEGGGPWAPPHHCRLVTPPLPGPYVYFSGFHFF